MISITEYDGMSSLSRMKMHIHFLYPVIHVYIFVLTEPQWMITDINEVFQHN